MGFYQSGTSLFAHAEAAIRQQRLAHPPTS